MQSPLLHEQALWVPKENFWEENFETISDIFETIAHHHPDTGILLDSSQSEHPTDETRQWMWTNLMGHQHGTQKGLGDKLKINREEAKELWQKIDDLNHGPYNFTEAFPSDKNIDYDKAFVLGGSPSQNTNRLMTVITGSPSESKVKEVVLMAGQRLRWDIPDESTINNIYRAVSSFSGTDINSLRKLSPWVKAQESKQTRSEWDRPYATEYELARLSVEAVFINEIDWDEYPIEETLDEIAPSFEYQEEGRIKHTAPRKVLFTTYNLKDGRKVHVTNGRPVPRPSGSFPKPTSDSTMREAIDYIGIDKNEKILLGTSVPHYRAALDALIRILSLRGKDVGRIDIAYGSGEPDLDVLTALGEIPATYKADQRLRALLAGEDPDSKKLLDL